MRYTLNENRKSDNNEVHIYAAGSRKPLCNGKSIVKGKQFRKIPGGTRIIKADFDKDETSDFAKTLQDTGDFNICGNCLAILHSTP